MLPFAIVFVVIFTDFFSKYWVHTHLPLMLSYPHYPYGGIAVFQNWGGVEFSISHLTNKGAAWGILSGYQDILVAVRILLIAGLAAYTVSGEKPLIRRIPLALIIAGATGNIIDYYAYGHVVDMLHFVLWGYDFPVFNIADSAVTIGVFWLIILTFFESRDSEVPA